MFRKLTLLLSLIFAVALTSPAVAQDVPTLDPADVEGLESAYARMYMMDIEGMLSTPMSDAATPSIDEVPFYAFVAVFTFDDAGNAESNFEAFSDDFAQGFFSESETEAETNEIDGLGDQAVEYVGELQIDETESAPSSLVTVQDGENILISVVSGGAEPGETSLGIVEFMLDNEMGEGEVEVVQEGTSTGGAFDLMPTAEDADVLNGLVPFMDMDLLAGGM